MAESGPNEDAVYLPAVNRKQGDASLIEATPGLARLTANTWWRVAGRALDTTLDTSTKVIKAAARGDSPIKIAHEVADDVKDFVNRAFGSASTVDEDDGHAPPKRRANADELRAKGAALLYRSADVRFNEDMHPAYERILDQLAPDEARILRFLAIEGAQPTVDVRTNRPFGVGSELVAEGLSMIGEEAGCRHLDRISAYLNNLFRLGLIWYSKEKVETSRYQVVEVQPKVVEAMNRAGRSPSTVHRSVHLTPFGEDFCGICLPLDDSGTASSRDKA